MCLTVRNNAKLKIAKEDIICYKRVIFDFYFRGIPKELHGKSFHGIIKDIEVDGIISIDRYYLYFCTNNEHVGGELRSNKFGYKYSYLADFDNVQSIIVNDIELMGNGYRTLFRDYPIVIGETYHSDLIKKNNKVHIGLHSYAVHKNSISFDNRYDVKCIIPKGSEYYEGIFDNRKSYASNCLKYVKIIENK